MRRAIAVAAALAVVADRIAWACISQWREDQATAMWLGLHYLAQATPVGLMNSRGVPNPNGIVLVAWLLSFLPNLVFVSVALGCIQALAMKAVSKDWLVLLPLLASVQLRGTSTELWAQWLLTTCNVLFVALVAANARKPRALWWFLAATLAALAPALYLAGIVNAIAYAVVWLVLATAGSELRRWTRWWPVVVIPPIVTWLTTWRLYPFALLRELPHGSWRDALRSLFLMPAALPTIVRFDLHPLFLDDPRIVPTIAYVLAAVAAAVVALQIVLAAIAYFRARHADITVIAAALLLVVAIPLSPLLGGFRWDRGERIDQAVQFLPLVLIIVFAAPRFRRVTAVAFAVVSLLAGWIAIHAQLTYRGNVLSEADVPLTQKEAVVSFARAPMKYDVAGGWTWLKPHPWYPGVYTVGRAFDYELLRRYGIVNRGAPHYIVSYAFNSPPPGTTNHRVFGRLRVSLARFSDY